MRLSERQIRALKPKEKRYDVWDGGGLSLRITPKGQPFQGEEFLAAAAANTLAVETCGRLGS